MRSTTITLALLLGLAPAVGAQRSGAHCDREGSTSIAFGHTGGNLRPAATEIGVGGEVHHADDAHPGSVRGTVPRDSVRAISRRAWRGGFAALPTAPRRPPRNPDAARPFIELRSPCGTHHVEYAPGTESKLFRELYARLERLTAPVAP